MLKTQFKDRLERSTKLYLDLVSHVPEAALGSKLVNLPSNTIGQQLWCVVGARHSYIKAAKAGAWDGFECPLDWDKTTDTKEVQAALQSTGESISEFLKREDSLSEAQLKFLFDLLEHEAQHHGQLARYLYGLKLGVPQSWKDRYHFD
ncbi:hypothetical protein [Bdellovibrio sp. HCB337]|uniref:hypothetical protein n=1 Tax=Bdellovibrio sp. HCB337 TaxID=3394358 RepID=UPI0039A59A18